MANPTSSLSVNIDSESKYECWQTTYQCMQSLATKAFSPGYLQPKTAHLLLRLANPSPCTTHNKYAKVPGHCIVGGQNTNYLTQLSCICAWLSVFFFLSPFLVMFPGPKQLRKLEIKLSHLWMSTHSCLVSAHWALHLRINCCSLQSETPLTKVQNSTNLVIQK